jgi:hypothetical protein
MITVLNVEQMPSNTQFATLPITFVFSVTKIMIVDWKVNDLALLPTTSALSVSTTTIALREIFVPAIHQAIPVCVA